MMRKCQRVSLLSLLKNSSLRKEELHPSSRLNELINSGHEPFDKRGLGFLGGNATRSSSKTIFVKPYEKKFPKKT